jgi:predicted DNA-binding transcriptional regulator AlpA
VSAPIIPALDHVAALLEEAARELRSMAGSSGGDLDPLRGVEAQCDVPGPEPVAPPPMTPPTSTAASPVTTADLPMLMTRREVAALLRIQPRTLSRWCADPSVGFPEPCHRARVLRWRRTAIERWLAAREA